MRINSTGSIFLPDKTVAVRPVSTSEAELLYAAVFIDGSPSAFRMWSVSITPRIGVPGMDTPRPCMESCASSGLGGCRTMCPSVLLAKWLAHMRGMGCTFSGFLESPFLRDSRSELESGVLENFITCG